ncbi:hypothetical protein BL241_03635 [Ralstonia solanacearum]|uniref:Lipoprotein n=1 Tax=Ralstonia solanacearum TaxID=305 RepID=A0A0S4U4E8_RALSL|nr:hypothetical protein BL241_03635 [Ralstonia solanacearum]CUV16995.1 conserved exported protein of unknown function [Ralstonia solanacearum]
MHFASRYAGFISVAALCLGLTACSDRTTDTAKQINREIEASKSISDPIAALAKLDPLQGKARETLNDCEMVCGSIVKAVRNLNDERTIRIMQSMDKLSPAKLAEYFNGDAEMVLQDDMAPRILAAAQVSAGAPADHQLLRVAGQIVRDGKYVIRSSDKAAEYFARAWLAGDPIAAANNAQLYDSLHDLNNAYLWALRCKGACRPDDAYRPVNPESLRSRLSTAAIRQAEQAALDPTVLALAGR